MHTCDHVRRHLGAMRDREAFADPEVDGHLADCDGCRAWLDHVDQLTRSLRLRSVTPPTFVDVALAQWDRRLLDRSARGVLAGRVMLAVAAVGCLVVGVLIAAGSAGHTHTGVTAQREVIILEVALAFGLACAAARPRIFLSGVVPILAVVAVVNIGVSIINLGAGSSTLLGEIAHLPFLVGLVGSLLIHRADPIRSLSFGSDRDDRLRA